MLRNREEKLNNNSFLMICFTIIILGSMMPIVARMISRFASTYAYMFVLLISAMLILLGRRFTSVNTYFNLLIPFILWKLLALVNWGDSLYMWGYRVLLELLPLMIGYYVITGPKSNLLLSRVIIFAFLITAATTAVGLVRYPDASRWLATVADSRDSRMVFYDMRNIGGYELIYSTVLLYPLLIWAYKKRKIRFVPTIAISVLVGSMAFLSSYTIAFLLFILSSFLYLLKRDLRVKDVFSLLIGGIIFYLLFTTAFSKAFLWLSEAIENENMSERLSALAGGYEGLKNSESKRVYLYEMSIRSFFAHPLFGSLLGSYVSTGGHSFILDYIAHYGLIGVALLIAMYRKLFKTFYEPMRDNPGFGYLVWTFMQAIILSTINTGIWLNVLGMFVPIIVYSIDEGEPKIEDPMGC